MRADTPEGRFMTYEGPTQSDYRNIQALNREFLRLARAMPVEFGMSDKEGRRLQALCREQTERLVTAPFLLCTMRENDLQLWREFLRDDPNNDLFKNERMQTVDISNLLAAVVGFLWQLNQRNAYAVRLVSAARSDWCDLVTDVTYFELVAISRHRGDLLSFRQVEGVDIWSKLLVDGVKPEKRVRTAAHLAVLQTLLTSVPTNDNSAWPVAACAAKTPRLRVANSRGHGKGG